MERQKDSEQDQNRPEQTCRKSYRERQTKTEKQRKKERQREIETDIFDGSYFKSLQNVFAVLSRKVASPDLAVRIPV